MAAPALTLGVRSERAAKRLRDRLDTLDKRDRKAWDEYLVWTRSVAGGELYELTERVAWHRLQDHLAETKLQRRRVLMQAGDVPSPDPAVEFVMPRHAEYAE